MHMCSKTACTFEVSLIKIKLDRCNDGSVWCPVELKKGKKVLPNLEIQVTQPVPLVHGCDRSFKCVAECTPQLTYRMTGATASSVPVKAKKP